VTAPNGVRHTYGYDSLNRLRLLTVAQAGGLGATLHAYEYKLYPSGHRHQVLEGGAPETPRTTTYGYDDLHRLTSETIAGDLSGQNGTIGYVLDKVGNRLSRSSPVAPIPSTANTFNARDWLDTDTYDANGNTVITSYPSGGRPPIREPYDRVICRNGEHYDAAGARITTLGAEGCRRSGAQRRIVSSAHRRHV
jgi:hypothetical protein